MCKVYAIASMKGGVTKTTTSLNLATVLALMGKKVLVADLDPQGSLSICAGVPNPDTLPHTTYTLLDAVMNEDKLPEPSEYIIPCENIDVIPCNIKLSAFELNRGHEIGAERALQTALAPLRDRYDVIIIDTLSAAAICSYVAAPRRMSVIPLKSP